MNAKRLLGIGAFAACVALTGLVAAETPSTVRADVVALDSHDSPTLKSRVTLNAGHDDGVEVGNKAYLSDGKGGKLSDFTIDRIGLRASSAFTGESTYAVQKSMVAVVSTRKCWLAGNKADLSTPDIASGKSPPAGHLFAKVTIASSEAGSQWGEGLPNGGSGSHGFRFEVDKGFTDGVIPGASAYLVPNGSGIPLPLGKIEIRWVSASSAGGWVTNPVGTVDDVKKAFSGKRLVIERAHCHAAK
jgi:hypothetical protein